MKTLKDLKLRSRKDNKEIRQEAIKWVKKWDKAICGQATSAWIIHFFNLTEEDLK